MYIFFWYYYRCQLSTVWHRSDTHFVVFCSDFTLLSTALRPHGLSWISPSLQSASIDHAIYFHKPIRADEWLLHDMESTQSAGSRGLNFGRIWQDGQLVCSTVQEGLNRLRDIDVGRA